MNDFERLVKVISEQLGVDEASVTPDTSFADDLGADSLDVVELVMGVENEFDIDIPDEDVENMVVVSDVLDYIKESIDGGLFNLGYLPGGNKSIHTMRESTLPAIQGAISLLKKGGVLVISVYPGHEEGNLEGKMVLEELSKLSRFEFCVTNFRIINSPDSPFIVAVEKYNK